MPRTEDGEFELVLGNKQLLSVFFIVVILLGVFFTMGYVVGRSSAPVGAASGGSAPRNESNRGERPSSYGAVPAPAPATPPSGEQEAAPQTESPAPSPEGKPLEVPPVGADNASAAVVQPEAGQTFVQVKSMLAEPEAAILVDVLGKKGFRAIVAPGPNEGRYRVLVGPVQDAAEAGRVKGDLEQAGFKGAFMKKY